MKSVDRPVRAKARHQKASEPAGRLRQHQEGVAHWRRHEPFVAGDGVAIPRRLRAGGIGAHVGAALLFGHAHAQRDAALLPPGPESWVIAARRDLGHELGHEFALERQRRHGSVRHGDGTEVPGLDLRGHVEAGRAQHLRGGAHRRCVLAPGRGRQTRGDALAHELVISGVKLDRVAPEALSIERLQLRRMLVGRAREIEHLGRAPVLAERR